MVMQVSSVSTFRDRDSDSAITTVPAPEDASRSHPEVAPILPPPLHSPAPYLSHPQKPTTQNSSSTSVVSRATSAVSRAKGIGLANKILESSDYEQYSYRAHVTGAVLFDSNGLPREYFTTAQLTLENWEQLIFQLLGLRWLLMSSLSFDHFSFARASSGHHTAVLLRQRESYVALLTENLQGKIYDIKFRQWLSTFDLTTLRHDERFQSF